SALFVKSASASTASRPALMTLRNAPLSGWDGRPYAPDLPDGEREIFLAGGLDAPNHVDPLQQIAVLVIRLEAG
ncbi:MAG TPA: hypothetical protein VGO54_14210, partial [Bradyrhizobium sp.]|nr:hypothetical protein [Bradyrhizobium sp.]